MKWKTNTKYETKIVRDDLYVSVDVKMTFKGAKKKSKPLQLPSKFEINYPLVKFGPEKK